MTVSGTDIATWLGFTPIGDEVALLDELAAVATAHVSSRVTDVNDVRAQKAIVMYGSRLFKRRASPEGTLDMGDYTGSIKSYDADIEALLAPIRQWGF